MRQKSAAKGFQEAAGRNAKEQGKERKVTIIEGRKEYVLFRFLHRLLAAHLFPVKKPTERASLHFVK